MTNTVYSVAYELSEPEAFARVMQALSRRGIHPLRTSSGKARGTGHVAVVVGELDDKTEAQLIRDWKAIVGVLTVNTFIRNQP